MGNNKPEKLGAGPKDEVISAWDLFKADETAEDEKRELNKKVEDFIRNSGQNAKKVDSMVDEPERFGVSPDEVDRFKTWLRERTERVKVEPNPEAETVIEGSQQSRLDMAKSLGTVPDKDFDIQKDQEKLENMPFTELMGEMFKRFSNLMESFSGGGVADLFAGMYSAKQVKEVKVDIEKAATKEPDPESKNDRSAEFVANALNLPVRPDTASLLGSMIQTPDFIYSEKKEDFLNNKDLKKGDVLFFSKFNDEEVKGKEKRPHLAAIISSTEPLKMTYMTEGGETKKELILDSPLFNEEFLGFVKIPETKETNIKD